MSTATAFALHPSLLGFVKAYLWQFLRTGTVVVVDGVSPLACQTAETIFKVAKSRDEAWALFDGVSRLAHGASSAEATGALLTVLQQLGFGSSESPGVQPPEPGADTATEAVNEAVGETATEAVSEPSTEAVGEPVCVPVPAAPRPISEAPPPGDVSVDDAMRGDGPDNPEEPPESNEPETRLGPSEGSEPPADSEILTS